MRYLPQTKNTRAEMLKAIGVDYVDELFADIPKNAWIKGKADLPDHKGELEVERILSRYASENRSANEGPFFLGAGCYHHHIPAAVDHIIQRSEFLTAYTPYQPEIAQGTLQALFEYQTMIAQITGQDVANASMYDGATALAEAALMALRIQKKRKKVSLANALHPDYAAVLKSYMGNFEDVEIAQGALDEDSVCLIVQYPDFYGNISDLKMLRKQCDESGAMLIVVVTEIVALGLLSAPTCADIVCGEAQSIGMNMSFGGPHLGFFANKEKYLRQMPGRLCGMTQDADGKRSFVLTLSTREQHIRRAKATSNICTNQGLCALAFTIHMSLLGEDGFKRLARLNHEAACKLADALDSVPGVKVLNETFFNEFVVELSKDAHKVIKEIAFKNILSGLPLENNKLLLAATEMTTDEDISALTNALKEALA